MISPNSSGFTNNNDNAIAIISLRPKDLLLRYVRGVAKQVLHESDNFLNKMLNEDYLEEHSVPVCTKLYQNNNELEEFLQSHCDVLVNLMLTSWMWPINKWGFDAHDQSTIQSLMATEYRPFVYFATNPLKNPTTLAVTYANPTRELVEDLARRVNGHKENEEALQKLRFKLGSGIAIITDSLDKNEYRDRADYCMALANPLNYFKSLDANFAKELLLSFYGQEEDLPEETDVAHLNKWFDMNTNLGIYMLTKPWMASRYRRSIHAADNLF